MGRTTWDDAEEVCWHSEFRSHGAGILPTVVYLDHVLNTNNPLNLPPGWSDPGTTFGTTLNSTGGSLCVVTEDGEQHKVEQFGQNRPAPKPAPRTVGEQGGAAAPGAGSEQKRFSYTLDEQDRSLAPSVVQLDLHEPQRACKFCNRTFRLSRLERHERACRAVSSRERRCHL